MLKLDRQSNSDKDSMAALVWNYTPHPWAWFHCKCLDHLLPFGRPPMVLQYPGPTQECWSLLSSPSAHSPQLLDPTGRLLTYQSALRPFRGACKTTDMLSIVDIREVGGWEAGTAWIVWDCRSETSSSVHGKNVYYWWCYGRILCMGILWQKCTLPG